MLNIIDRHVIARESNVLRVDFRRDPDPPAPHFPGAIGLRLGHWEGDEEDTPTAAIAIRSAARPPHSRRRPWPGRPV